MRIETKRVAKSEGRPWVDHCIDLYVDHCIHLYVDLCKENHPEPRGGLCPELLADFRIPKPPGCSQGNPGAVFPVQSEWQIFRQRGRVGSLPGAWRASWVPGLLRAL